MAPLRGLIYRPPPAAGYLTQVWVSIALGIAGAYASLWAAVKIVRVRLLM